MSSDVINVENKKDIENENKLEKYKRITKC